MRFLLTVALFVAPLAHAKVQYEGFFVLEMKEKQVGYSVLRHDIDPAKKLSSITYYIVRGEGATQRRYAVKSVSKMNSPGNLVPHGYEIWEWQKSGPPIRTVGTFKPNQLEITVHGFIPGQKGQRGVVNYKAKVPPGSFTSTFLSHVLVGQKAKPGQTFTFQAFAEEARTTSPGTVNVLRDMTTTDGTKITQILDDYQNEQTEQFYFADGSIMGFRNRRAGMILYAVPHRDKALGKFGFHKEEMQLAFGDVPFGLTNPVTRAKEKWNAKDAIAAFPAPPERSPAKTPARKLVVK